MGTSGNYDLLRIRQQPVGTSGNQWDTVVQNEVQVKQNISLTVHTSLETSVRYVSESVDEKIWHWDLLESWKNMAFLVFFCVFGCHFHSAVLFPRVFGTAYDIYPPQTSA